MIPELGQVFLVAALASALLQFLGGISSLSKNIPNIELFVERTTAMQTFFLIICFGLLTTSFLQDDFQSYMLLQTPIQHCQLPINSQPYGAVMKDPYCFGS